MNHPKRLIIGISGASGIIYGVRILQALHGSDIETHLVMSDSAKLTLSSEMDLTIKEVESLASVVHNNKNVGATIASGSFKTLGMVVAPCSIRSLSEIAWGSTTSLLSRAADVVLKERRRLVLMVRETPLHFGHLKSMTQATENGAVIMPPVPMFYSKPKTLDDIVNHTTGRCLDLFEIDTDLVKRWSGMGKQTAALPTSSENT
ncbi:UbiX family flavin prenyltransferase [Polynucleobacter sp. Latsch14-2]|jgi:4-hydroxy-3-polyprenylbenzoate decarboxylase|uniref:UbiX family flavin prenyltransferase n=1 Tax=Polynucleobacter sp. Latsch14-2 TaxID=2576920 RepID=UPI001C0B822E|nr:UbiX family flavin prenyltransferase [Polynucleobacter sp. Latsch14-2]MBU3614276.1 UbiX family flavin prenyltransferase [Polynucleobacter sp. Latsch14-2]